MKITFVGATHEVTGSCYFLEAAGKKFLVDCGMEQGPDNFENIPIPVPASELDFVLLTHAHIDHSGKLPVLYAEWEIVIIQLSCTVATKSNRNYRIHRQLKKQLKF